MTVDPTTLVAPLIADVGATYHNKFGLLFDRVGELQTRAVGSVGNVEEYGAVGDGTTDDTVAIQTAFDSGVSALQLGPSTFKITDTVVLPFGVDLDFASGVLLYAGTRDRPALQVGVLDEEPVFHRNISNVNIVAATLDHSNLNFVGMRYYCAIRSRISITRISKFTMGYEAYSAWTGYAYNYHVLGALTDNKYGLVLTADGQLSNAVPSVGEGSFVNENIFMGGDIGPVDYVGTGDSYGVWLRQINSGSNGHNLNRWFAPCFEMGAGNSGDERVPFFFDGVGAYNSCYDARWETGRGAFAKLVGANAVYNRFESHPYGAVYPEDAINQSGGATGNVWRDQAAGW